MIEPRRMALQAAGDLPQARRTGKLAIKQRDELAPGRKQPRESASEDRGNAIVMPHGVDSDFVSRRRANV